MRFTYCIHPFYSRGYYVVSFVYFKMTLLFKHEI